MKQSSKSFIEILGMRIRDHFGDRHYTDSPDNHPDHAGCVVCHAWYLFDVIVSSKRREARLKELIVWERTKNEPQTIYAINSDKIKIPIKVNLPPASRPDLEEEIQEILAESVLLSEEP